MKASELFVNALERGGVKYIFGIPGEENLDLLESQRELISVGLSLAMIALTIMLLKTVMMMLPKSLIGCSVRRTDGPASPVQSP